MSNDSHIPECIICGGAFAPDRWALGYKTCLPCGEAASRQVRRTIAPMHKSNYMLITDLADLKGLNNKGGLVK
jgi:hypothetical protein